MISTKRRTVLKAGTAALAAPYFSKAFAKSDVIRIASIYDESGILSNSGRPMAEMLNMAVEDINKQGGLLGKQLELIRFDTQSSNQLYGQYAIEAATKHRVSAVFGAMTSASREVIRPLLRRYNTLYFYSTQYEGGVCDRNTFCVGTTPGQKAIKIDPYVLEKFGKKIYVVAADYNLGHIISKWHRRLFEQHGGSIAGVEFFPLEQTDFGASIKKIQAAQPDAVMADLVGTKHVGFFRQWAASGMSGRVGLASTIFGTGDEQLLTNPREHNGILTSACYFPEIEIPGNDAFVKRAADHLSGQQAALNELPMMAYYAPMLWAEGVKLAGTVERMPVIEALETGLSYEGPGGKITVDGKSHHVSHDIYIAEARDHGFKILETYRDLLPSDTSAVCDLEKNPNETRQFVIDS